MGYEVMECDPRLADTAAFCEHYGVPLERSANTILVESRRGPRGHVLCVLLATTQLDVNNSVRAATGFKKASFATAETTRELTGMEIGGVTPFGLYDLAVLVDDRVLVPDWVVLGSGTRSSKIRVSPEVFRRLGRARVMPGLARPPAY